MNKPLKIMVVDDESAVRNVVVGLLARRGWHVDGVDNARKGFEEIRRGDYDLVLTDINMPGINGMEFLRMVKEEKPGLPVIFITGYPSIDLAVEAMKKGAADFLAKPFKAEQLEITVRKAVDAARDSGDGADAAAGGRTVEPRGDTSRHRLEDKIKELSILHTISEMLDDVSTKEDIFKMSMDLALIISGAERSFIMIYEKRQREFVVRAATGYDGPEPTGMVFSAAQGPLGGLVDGKRHIYVDAGTVLDPLLSRAGGSAKDEALFVMTMLINKEVVAALGLTGMDRTRRFTDDEMTLLQNLVGKVALKLENLALTENIYASILSTVHVLINALDARDTYTKEHSNRVTSYALEIASGYGVDQDTLDCISFAGPLHDIGKIGVRDSVLLKEGPFLPDEKETMKSHVLRGEEILKPLNLLDSEKAVVLHHHEHYNGNGYPMGLRGDEIPIAARIFSVADTFDAMTSTRPYRKALKASVARAEIIRCAGTQFDPLVVEAFLETEFLRHFDDRPRKDG
ncbi:MAG TPA: response regulator [Deltaproteobacteria bacterium]|nr:response regulator [Deltaproteobacteria bacterium]